MIYKSKNFYTMLQIFAIVNLNKNSFDWWINKILNEWNSSRKKNDFLSWS